MLLLAPAGLAQPAPTGGLTLAESEETAVVFGMPKALISQGGAQKVLPSDRVARQVTEWAAQIATAAAR